ncbi:vesicle-associated protein 1-1-like [Papaver somniferum]|uniref:vesicle-associated protein 1-1-like n=1 Tax=Papaver somniferum TaxID=3469 RepID=UPI000E6FB4E7|nr:vesicle-associated protein 1-1-like [Papaver somniferum]
MHFEDALLLLSFIAPKGATREDITPEMFEDESGKVDEEFELRVIYVPTNPLIPEGSEDGSSHRAYGVGNGNLGTCLLDALYSLLPKSSWGGSSARASGVENENQKYNVLDPVTGDGVRQQNLQKRSKRLKNI